MENQNQSAQAAEMMRHFEKLIYDSTPPYLNIAAPLLAAIFGLGAGYEKLQIAACVFGVVVSLVWWISVERLRRVFDIHRNKAIETDVENGVFKGSKTKLNQDLFLRLTFRGTKIRSLIHFVGIVVFSLLLYLKLGA